MIRVGFLYTRLRVEEKYLLEELEKHQDVYLIRINDGDRYFDISHLDEPVDVLFERSVSYSRGLYISKIFEANEVLVVNSARWLTLRDKYVTHQILVRENIATPRV